MKNDKDNIKDWGGQECRQFNQTTAARDIFKTRSRRSGSSLFWWTCDFCLGGIEKEKKKKLTQKSIDNLI